MVGPHKAIVISSLQHRRQSLAALLRSMPDIGEIHECENMECLEINLYFHPSQYHRQLWGDGRL